MSEEVKPFTAEEWANDGREVIDGYVDMEMGVVDVSFFWTADDPCDRETRLLAALLLQHAGPDGGPLFTWADVGALREEYESEWAGVSKPNGGDALLSIADRLASLLPPREP